MTEKQARILIKIVKYFVITLFVMFFVIIMVQSIKISSLSKTQQTLQTEYNQKQTLNESYEKEIGYIEDNFNRYSEEELRKEDYITEGYYLKSNGLSSLPTELKSRIFTSNYI